MQINHKNADTISHNLVTASDVEGAIFCRFIAQALVNLPVQCDFIGHGSFSGVVTGWDAKENHGGAILHQVTFSDGDVAEYSYAEIIKHHEKYLQDHTTQPTFQLNLPNLHSSIQALTQTNQDNASADTPADQGNSTAYTPNPLPLPRSFTNYPLRLPFEGSTVQAAISGRRISPHGIHEWKVQLPAPHDAVELWIDTQTLHSHIARARKNCKINAPTSSPPTLFALKSFDPILHGTKWTKNHECVGTTVSVYLEHPSGKRSKESKVLHLVTIEAAFSSHHSGFGKTHFWGRTQDDLAISVLFPDERSLAEALHANDIERFGVLFRRSRRPGKHHVKPVIIATEPGDELPNVAPGNESFAQSLNVLKSLLPSDPIAFYQNGFHLTSKIIPRTVIHLYRRGLGIIARGIIRSTPEDDTYYLLLLLYDAMILAPFDHQKQSFAETIRERVASFLSGDWAPLLAEMQFRDPSHTPGTVPLATEPGDTLAMR